MSSRFLSLLFALIGLVLITWPGGASAQYFDPWGPPPGYYGPPMGYRPPQMQVGPQRGPSGHVDPGGRWEDYVARADRMNGHRIDYVCKSFCTIFLKTRNVCVTHNARLGFHGISYGGPDSQNIDTAGNAMYLRRLPRQIQAWVLSHRALESKRLTYMSGSEAISLGIRDCDRPK
ncbi:hypothetical protein HZC00_00810 [Candidatus Kaiserbacteria bacterium]|nr:hypothetical protein [Candidatus Kaiserbacteria bacterium]